MTEKEIGVDFLELVGIDPFNIDDPDELRAHIDKLARASIPKEPKTKSTTKRITKIEVTDEKLQIEADKLGLSLEEMKLILAKARRAMKITAGRGN